MIFAVWIPLLVPFLAVPAARRLAEALPPRPAAWLLAAASTGLALCSAAALGLLALAGALRLPFVAALGHLVTPLDEVPGAVALPAACAAAALLALRGVALIRTARRQFGEVRTARRRLAPSTGELAVVRDPCPYAYALPGRPGRIVVTTGMLRALDPAEREALFAHERAHLRGRHHLFLAAAELAAHLHPSLRSLRAPSNTPWSAAPTRPPPEPWATAGSPPAPSAGPPSRAVRASPRRGRARPSRRWRGPCRAGSPRSWTAARPRPRSARAAPGW